MSESNSSWEYRIRGAIFELARTHAEDPGFTYWDEKMKREVLHFIEEKAVYAQDPQQSYRYLE